MKKTFLFFFCVLLTISLKSMDQKLSIIESYFPSKIGNFIIKREQEKAVASLNDLCPDIIINHMFPDNKNVDYEFAKLVNIHRADKKQYEEHIAILNTYIKTLVNLSMATKKLRTNKLLEEIAKRNVQHVCFNSIYKYRRYAIFKDNPYLYCQEIFSLVWFTNICSLAKRNVVLNGDYCQIWGINYKTKINKISNFGLHVYLIKDTAQDFVFTDNSLYEHLYGFCEEINAEFYEDKYTSSLCETLKKECIGKKTLSIQTVQRFLGDLNYKCTQNKNSAKHSIYFQKALEFLKIGKMCCSINLCFGFKFIDKEGNNLGSFHKIMHILRNNFTKENEINNDKFFGYVQNIFNDDSEKTKKIVSACEGLLLKNSKSFERMSYHQLDGDYFVNFQIQNKDGMSHESIIPLDLLHFAWVKTTQK